MADPGEKDSVAEKEDLVKVEAVRRASEAGSKGLEAGSEGTVVGLALLSTAHRRTTGHRTTWAHPSLHRTTVRHTTATRHTVTRHIRIRTILEPMGSYRTQRRVFK